MKGLLIISTYPPRKCGIATFSQDLRDNLETYVDQVYIAALSESFSAHEYPSEVRFQIRQKVRNDYVSCANWINSNNYLGAVIIQHEYGIYGGQDGEFILDLITRLKRPFVLVTHTILPRPSANRQRIISSMGSAASAVVCMTGRSREYLEKIYKVPKEKICIIPHGVPKFKSESRDALKHKFGFEGRRIITTFGLIGPGKGLETGLDALNRVVRNHPEALYIIAGKTHPVLLREQGELYREMIQQKVVDLKLENNVHFVNRYLSIEEIGHYLHMSDIYLSPYPNPDQAVSGPLSYAVGCGRAVIATPYEHALELLGSGRGLIANDMSPEALGVHLQALLDDPKLQSHLEMKCVKAADHLSWENAAEKYFNIAKEVIASDKAGQTIHRS